MDFKWYAALAYVRANKLNHNVVATPDDRFGLIASGKAYNDLRQALADLGLDDDTCRSLGIRIHKVNVVWPLEATITRDFAQGLKEILVVEEKRQMIEYQLKEQLYNWRNDVRPTVLGKFDEQEGDLSGGEWSNPNPGDNWLLRPKADLTPAIIAKAVAKRLKKLGVPADIVRRMDERIAVIEAKDRALVALKADTAGGVGDRTPWFCSGCPHNTSTKVPEGSRAVAGIGCHYMVNWMDRSTSTFTQMGGEGVPWVGQAPFTTEKHIFANLGDGTYYHSGLLAIRQSLSSNVNITYKILFNGAVAMTGGQPVDGQIDVASTTRELEAEGVKRILVVSDEPERYNSGVRLAEGTTVHHRDELDALQRELREVPGVTVIIYDQTCATEKRRRRKRGTMAQSPRRVVVNESVCEGCGDCSVQSNCLSVEPVETEFGRKRRINQNTCNQDFSCANGFCPSFVSVEGKLKKAAPAKAQGRRGAARDPAADAAERRYGVGHRRRRHRRHRRHHDRPAAGHGRPPRGQGRDHAGRGRPRAEGRRDLEPHPDRRHAGRHPHDQGGRGQGRRGDRLRGHRHGQPGDAVGDARRPHLRRAQHARLAHRHLRQQPGLAVPGRPVRDRPSSTPSARTCWARSTPTRSPCSCWATRSSPTR